MSDRVTLRLELKLFAGACLLLAACFAHEPRPCGTNADCPAGNLCSDGACVPDDNTAFCPARPPADDEEIIAPVDLVCEYDVDCSCGGECRPTRICTAAAGEVLGCFYPDYICP